MAHLAVRGFCSGLWSNCALFILLASGISAAAAYFLFLLYLSLQHTGIQTLQMEVLVDGQG